MFFEYTSTTIHQQGDNMTEPLPRNAPQAHQKSGAKYSPVNPQKRVGTSGFRKKGRTKALLSVHLR